MNSFRVPSREEKKLFHGYFFILYYFCYYVPWFGFHFPLLSAVWLNAKGISPTTMMMTINRSKKIYIASNDLSINRSVHNLMTIFQSCRPRFLVERTTDSEGFNNESIFCLKTTRKSYELKKIEIEQCKERKIRISSTY
jgi:hypothetical protein